MKSSITDILDGQYEVSQKLQGTINLLGESAIPALIDNMIDPDLMNVDSRGNGYIPIIASTILAQRGEQDALLPMLDAWKKVDHLSETAEVFERNIAILAAENLQVLLDYYYSCTDEETKRHLSDILAKTNIRNKSVFDIHVEQLKNRHEISPGYLEKYEDQNVLELLFNEFDKTELSKNVLGNSFLKELAHSIEALGGVFNKKQQDKIDQVRKSFHKQFVEPIMSNKKNKVGRNEACPCGSGKKYKKCCLMLN